MQNTDSTEDRKTGVKASTKPTRTELFKSKAIQSNQHVPPRAPAKVSIGYQADVDSPDVNDHHTSKPNTSRMAPKKHQSEKVPANTLAFKETPKSIDFDMTEIQKTPAADHQKTNVPFINLGSVEQPVRCFMDKAVIFDVSFIDTIICMNSCHTNPFDFAGYTFKVLDVTPYPDINIKIDPEGIKIKMVVTEN